VLHHYAKKLSRNTLPVGSNQRLLNWYLLLLLQVLWNKILLVLGRRTGARHEDYIWATRFNFDCRKKQDLNTQYILLILILTLQYGIYKYFKLVMLSGYSGLIFIKILISCYFHTLNYPIRYSIYIYTDYWIHCCWLIFMKFWVCVPGYNMLINYLYLFQCRNCDYQQVADNPCIYVNKITHEVE
jgi:hypothetical protein